MPAGMPTARADDQHSGASRAGAQRRGPRQRSRRPARSARRRPAPPAARRRRGAPRACRAGSAHRRSRAGRHAPARRSAAARSRRRRRRRPRLVVATGLRRPRGTGAAGCARRPGRRHSGPRWRGPAGRPAPPARAMAAPSACSIRVVASITRLPASSQNVSFDCHDRTVISYRQMATGATPFWGDRTAGNAARDGDRGGDRRAGRRRSSWPHAARGDGAGARRRARRQDARGRGRRGARSTPARPSSPCAGSSTRSSPRPAARSTTPSRCARSTILARHAWDEGGRLDLFADRQRSADAIGAFAGPAEARGYLAFCAQRGGSTRRSSGPSSAPTGRACSAWSPRVGLRGCGPAGAHPAVRDPVGRSGAPFPRPAAAPAVRPLRHLCGSSPFLAPATLMLVAHVEQEGVWLVEGGMHRLAAGAGRRWPRATAPSSATAPRPREIAGRARRASPACGWPRRADRGRRGRWSTPTPRPWRGGLLRRRRSPARCRAPSPGSALALGPDLAAARRDQRLSARSTTTSSSPATTAASSTTSSARPAAADAHRLCLRPGPRRRRPRGPTGRERAASASSTRRRPATRAPSRQRRSSNARSEPSACWSAAA